MVEERKEGIWEGMAHNIREDMTKLLNNKTLASMAVILACSGAGVNVDGASGTRHKSRIGDDRGRAGRVRDGGGSRLRVEGGDG
jgi:hypothetical protein